MTAAAAPLSIVIPTYRREQVLVDSITWLLEQDPPAAQLIVVDQTEQHEPAVRAALESWQAQGRIDWLRLDTPSITRAMNRGLAAATQPQVLFLDDDIRPAGDLVGAHVRALAEFGDVLLAGRVVQPWEQGVDLSQAEEFRFAGSRGQWIEEFMGGNFSLLRETAIALGGFDENFVRVAYRFEAEFASRWRASGRRIRFEPAASIDHLKEQGGTRTFGEFLTTWKPNHTVGAHYFLLRTRGRRALPAMLARVLTAAATRHHLRRPWWIPATVFSEAWGMAWACRLALRGPRFIRVGEDT
jgi:GT2 family glycosyltransferase